MARKRSLTGAQQMGFARGDLDPADFNPDEYNSYDAKTIRSTTYVPPRTVTPAPQASGTLSSLGRVGQDSEMSNRVFQSTIGSTAAPTPAVTSPDFSLAAIGANTAGAFPADSGLTEREGTSGASGSYTGPDDIYGWEDGVNTGTVDRLDNGRSWVYRDGMGNVLGEVDKSMARAEREATVGLAPPPEPVIDPEPPPFPEPDPLPAVVDPGPELGQELEGELPPELTQRERDILSEGYVSAEPDEDQGPGERIYEYEDIELGQDLEEEPPFEEPVVSPVEEPELGQDLEVDLVGTEPPPVIAPDGTELVGGLPLVDAYHAMKVGEGPVLTEAQISQLPPELLVEARAWMAANVDGPRYKSVTGPVDEVELGQDLEADLLGEEVVQPAAKGAGVYPTYDPESPPVMSLEERRQREHDDYVQARTNKRDMKEGWQINDLPISDEAKELLREIYGDRLFYGSLESILMMAQAEMRNRLRLEQEAEGEQEWDEYLAQLKPRPTGEMDAYWGGIPGASGLQQGPTYVEDPYSEKAFGLGGEGQPDIQAAWEVWEELPAYEKNQNWGTTRWPAGDFGEWYRLEWPRHSQWQDPGLHGRYDFPIIEDRSGPPYNQQPYNRNTAPYGSPWEDL